MIEPVAVVGAGALLPGSPCLDDFWRTVVTGRDLMTDVPASRWLIDDYYDADPRAVDKTYGRRGAFLPEIDFDPLRYGIPPNNLSAIDTSQLLALLVAEQVLADCVSGPPDGERVSVLIGASSLERIVEASARLQRPVWLSALRQHGVAEDVAQSVCDRIAASYVPWQEETFPGLLTNVVSGRIANKFDLHGANHTTDAACASSLAALNTAVAELSLRRCDLVITGGVDTTTDITMYTCFSRTPALSPTGDCRPFAAAADGTMLGEGLVLFALKRLADAERDGDRVYAVIRGVGASSDGRGSAIYAPTPEGQVRALRRAYEAAGYGPETVELVEAHGTGTSAGDTAEFAALRQVFDSSGRPDRQWCALGSVKSQIGHTKAAAGAAGLLKAVLSLHHKVLPPTIKVDQPNPALDLPSSPFYLNTRARPWIRPDGVPGGHPRRASVSSFGFGGTNFHVALEEYQPPVGGGAGGRLAAGPTELVLFGAESPAALRDLASRLDLGSGLTALARRTQAEFRHTAQTRLAVVARDTDDLAAKLAEATARIESGQPLGPHLSAHYATGPVPVGRVGFLFPGQGSQYVGMGGDLATHLSWARAPWDRTASLDLGGQPLHRVVFPPPAFTDAERDEQEARLTSTEWAQPALAVHSLALLDVLDAIGLAPDCVAGHSFGELVALHAAGAYDADTLVRLARRRGELMAGGTLPVGTQPGGTLPVGTLPVGTQPGGMLAVNAAREAVEALIAGQPDVWIANHNAPQQVVLAGTRPALEVVAVRLAADGVSATRLNAATAFHSPLVAPAREPLLACLRDMKVSAPRLEVYGDSDARTYPADPDEVRLRLAAQLAEPVAFVDIIEAMYASGVRTFVEVGAGTALTGLVGQILAERPHTAVGLDRRGRHGLTSLQEGLGRLSVSGVAMDLPALWTETASSGAAPARRLSKSAVRLDGGNYGRPYPPPASVQVPPAALAPPVAAAPPAVLAPPVAAVPSAVPVMPGPSIMDDGWLRVIEDAHRQTAEAHSRFQQTMADSHLAYLRMTETSLAGLLGAAVGEAPAMPPPRADTPAVSAGEPSEMDTIPVRLASVAAPEATPPLVPAPEQPPVAPPTDAPMDSPMDAESIGSLLLSVVAERTGYPVEILNIDMELDTDLGIDSIKKVEILSAVRERVGNLPSGELSALTTLRTLRAIAERVGHPSTVTDAASPAEPRGDTRSDDELVRQTLRVVAAPRSGLSMLGLTGAPLAVTDDGLGIAPLVAARLRGHGIPAEVVARVPQDAGGVILLDGLRAVASADEAIEVERAALRAARSVAGQLEAAGGVFVTVQDTGGAFGLAGSAGADIGAPTPVDPARAWLGGLVALARTAAKEWPRAAVKAIDCATAGRPAAAVADAIVSELLGGGGAAVVGLRADGTRVVPDLAEAPIGRDRSRIGPHSVVVATGGARGVTAAALRLLASQQHPRLVLLGRTPLSAEPEGLAGATDETGLVRLLAQRGSGTPAEVAARARRVLAVREIRETLDALERSGAKAKYMSIDVRDVGALADALAGVRRDWGPITAIVHAAGVLADGRIGDKTDDQFARVFDTKVDGLRALLAATVDDPLEVLCAFSSVAAVFGNAGQAEYAMANEVLNQVLAAERARRPDCLVRAIAWGPWEGGMVTPALAERFRDAGVPLIDPAAGARAFVAELASPAGEVLVIRSARADAAILAPAGAGLAAEVTVALAAYPYLADHQVGGVAVLPVATVLDWFAGAAGAWRPGARQIVIRDLRVLDKVALPRLADGGHRLVLRGQEATAQDGPALDLDLRDDAGRPHYRGSVATAPPPVPGSWPVPADLAPLPHPYGGATLFHGPGLQALRGAPGVGAAGAHGAVIGLRGLGWEAAAGEVDVAALDGALQLAVLWARRAGTGDTLPMAIGECRVHRRGAVEEETRCVVRAVRADESSAVCDVALLDADGMPRVELLGVHLVRRPGS